MTRRQWEPLLASEEPEDVEFGDIEDDDAVDEGDDDGAA